MGYSTYFKGVFRANKELPSKLIKKINHDLIHPKLTEKGSENQWIVADQNVYIMHNGNERFSDYIEWIDFILANVLLPNGYTLTGTVIWQGDDVGDIGSISAKGNKIYVGKPLYEYSFYDSPYVT